jgi:hypothetical protein
MSNRRTPRGGHDCAFDNRGVAHDHAPAPLGIEHFDRHFAVRFGAAQIDQNDHSGLRPCAVDRVPD